MTQAFNLSQLANNLNSSGQLDATDGLNGLVPLANGGTGATNTVNAITAGTGITTSVSGQTVTINASGSGTVTSVATGNGLQGGTITTSGTLAVACPSFNSVGSYCFVRLKTDYYSAPTSGSNYAAGTGWLQFTSAYSYINQSDYAQYAFNTTNNLSGTWKWMAAQPSDGHGNDPGSIGIACRVS